MTEIALPSPPYPACVLARGWRLEIDMETFKRSDTWKLAKTGAMRGALLLLWAEAWQEKPCGTLPDDDELIALMIDMPMLTFAKHRSVLMRGWHKANDGRLYHDTITIRVLAMLDKRAKDARRSASRRGRAADDDDTHEAVTDASRVTHAGPGGEFDTKHQAPSTKHRKKVKHTLSSTDAGSACLLMRKAGIGDTNPGHPDLLALLEAEVTDAEITGAAESAVAKGKGFAYAIGTLKRQRIDAANTAGQLHRGPLPSADDRKSRQLATAAVLTGATRTPSQPETIDVESRILPS